MQALVASCKHRDVHLAIGSPAIEATVDSGRTTGVRLEKGLFSAPVVVNCAGAWSGEIGPYKFPMRPVKGHMLALVAQHAEPGTPKTLVQHVTRNPGIVYVVPRSDGRHIVGSTLEEAGYDKRVDPDVIQRLHQGAANLIPYLGEARILEAWTGLRPTAPDKLPLLGSTPIAGYFVATGHYRDGIMLAPITARSMSRLIRGEMPEVDLAAFSPQRFSA
jgi:glycine/D-amino acid oxidase-like deaminating enzyme